MNALDGARYEEQILERVEARVARQGAAGSQLSS